MINNIAERFLESKEGKQYINGGSLHGALGSYLGRTWKGAMIPDPDIIAVAVKRIEREADTNL